MYQERETSIDVLEPSKLIKMPNILTENRESIELLNIDDDLEDDLTLFSISEDISDNTDEFIIDALENQGDY